METTMNTNNFFSDYTKLVEREIGPSTEFVDEVIQFGNEKVEE